MIEKITDALNNEYLVYNDGDWNSAIDRAIKIVQEVAKEYGKEVKNCATCANNTDFDEIDNGCYMCCKGLEDNYEPIEQKGE